MDALSLVVVNTGSSSVKLAAFELARATVRERARRSRELDVGSGGWEAHVAREIEALGRELEAPPDVVAHRVVHGGRGAREPVEITAAVEREIERRAPLAPLHHPAALAGIRAARRVFPDARPLAFYDTAFHAGRAEASLVYPLPAELCEREEIWRFGFHGIAHASLLEQTARALRSAPERTSAVTLQLGHGCSACAIRDGRSLETSMGFSPFGGLVMPARPGDLDPGLLLHLLRSGHGIAELETLLDERSGLVGIAGSSDVRELEKRAASGDARARLALEVFARAIVAVAGAYFTLLDGAGALVFGGGIGAGSAKLRELVCAGLSAWDVRLDPLLNEKGASAPLGRPGSRPIFAFTTDEESWIARALLGGTSG